MKLATYKDGSRDGQLVVVSRDLATAHFATGIATRLQHALDDWNFIAPLLQDLSVALNNSKTRHAFAFDPAQCMAPLPRAFQWVVGSACLSHVELERQSRGAEMPANLHGDPLMAQGASDDFIGPCDPMPVADITWGVDFEGGVAVVTGDVGRGARPEQALEGVRLLMLANGWSLRQLMPTELAKGLGPVQGKPATAFSPVAVTPDELGEAWHGGRVHLPLHCHWNGRQVGHCDAGLAMDFHFGQLVAHLAKTRNVRAGSIVGSGAVSHRDAGQGYSCIVDKRALETREYGEPRTGFLQYGDVVRIEMKRDNQSVFGAIEQQVVECD